MVVAEDESIAAAKAKETQMIADDAEVDLNKALPYLKNAIKGLHFIEIQDRLGFSNDPAWRFQLLKEVARLRQGQCVLENHEEARPLHRGPELPAGERREGSILRSSLASAFRRFESFRTSVSRSQVSKACKSMCMWVRAMHTYSNVLRVVAPKRERYAAAKAELDITMVELKEKQAQLKEVENHIAQLKVCQQLVKVFSKFLNT